MLWQSRGGQGAAANASTSALCVRGPRRPGPGQLGDPALYVLATIGALGGVCNALVLLTLLLVPSLRCRSSRFTSCLALSDLALCLLLTSPLLIQQVPTSALCRTLRLSLSIVVDTNGGC